MMESERSLIIEQRVIEGLIMRTLIEDVLSKAAGCKLYRIKEGLNPYLYQLEDASPLVIEDYYGVPGKIYTPVGYIPINVDYSSWDKLHIRKKELFFDILEELDIVEYKERIKSDYGYLGGWRKQGNCKPLFRDRSSYIEYNDAMMIYNHALRELSLKL